MITSRQSAVPDVAYVHLQDQSLIDVSSLPPKAFRVISHGTLPTLRQCPEEGMAECRRKQLGQVLRRHLRWQMTCMYLQRIQFLCERNPACSMSDTYQKANCSKRSRGYYVRPSLTEYERTQHDKINQELERQAEATERRFDIDVVAENVDNSL